MPLSISSSYISVSEHGTMYVGVDATRLYAAIQLRRALILYKQTGMRMTRGANVTSLLKAVTTNYTQRTYKARDIDHAISDMDTWIEAMRSALPITKDGKEVA